MQYNDDWDNNDSSSLSISSNEKKSPGSSFYSPERLNSPINKETLSWNEFLSNVSQNITNNSDSDSKFNYKYDDHSMILQSEAEYKKSDYVEKDTSLSSNKNRSSDSSFYSPGKLTTPTKTDTLSWNEFLSNVSKNDSVLSQSKTLDTTENINNKSKINCNISKKRYISNNKCLLTSTPLSKKPRIESPMQNISDFSSNPNTSKRSLRKTPVQKITPEKESNLQTEMTIYNEAYFMDHMKLLHGIEDFPWHCFQCSIKFSKLVEFMSHMISKHPDKETDYFQCHFCDCRDYKNIKKFACRYCPFRSRALKLIQCHMKVHLSPAKVRCDFCDKSFSNALERTDHVKSHHYNDRAECLICEKLVTNLELHLRKCHSNIIYQCMMCNEQFKFRHGLELHEIKKHSRDFVLRCDICGFGLMDYAHRKRHMDLHDRHVNENGWYLPLPEKYVNRLQKIAESKIQPIFVEAKTGPDEDDWYSDGEIDIDTLKENVRVNSKGVDTFDLKFFAMAK